MMTTIRALTDRQVITDPKNGKDGQIEYVVNYHDKKSDNSFTITTTLDLSEAMEN